ncbi:hypothetical protein JCM10908_004348 [Rhodotorula pacifica]|uniref:uncharacterized protein n=1 Tax=Rhodotorula pacifica TaxID=1495444 RepID=UPI00316FD17A
MATARTTHVSLESSDYTAEPKRIRNKLRKEEHTGSVLPPPSQWSKGPIVYGHATTLGGVGQTGYQVPAAAPTPHSASIATRSYGAGRTTTGTGYGGAGAAAGTSYGTTMTGSGLKGRSFSTKGGTYGQGTAASGQLQQKIEEAKEKNRQRRERQQVKRRPDELLNRNLPVDESGVAHDAEYLHSRTPAPMPVPKRPPTIHETPNADDSASSSSASDSDASGFGSSPYTYQSTHRTTTTSSHPASAAHTGGRGGGRYPSTMSAVPPHLSGGHRYSLDSGPSGASYRRPTSPSLHDGSSGHYSAYDRIGPGYGSRVTSSRLRAISTPHATTASYQPPAPAFNPQDPLRTAGSSTASGGGDAGLYGGGGARGGGGPASLVGSTARLSLNDTASNPNESGYNKAVKAGHAVSSTRPPKMDGTALDAGMHGLTRSWDGFKLDMRFGAHKVGKKVSRKLNSAIG